MPHTDPLARFVASVHVGGPTNPGRRPVLPDGCIDVLWMPGMVPWVAGPDTGPVPITISDLTNMVRVQLRTGRASALVGPGVDQLRDQRVPISEIWKADAWTSLEACTDATVGRELLINELRNRIPIDWEPDREVELMLQRCAEGRSPPSLATSQRQLRRRFVRAVGYGPKTFERIMRFQRFLSAPKGNLAFTAAVVGYADQPHMTREVKRLAGLTPAVVLAA